MEIDYQEISLELDAREILRYLNNLGIHNISGEVLKYFIRDLKKLIKYDLEKRNESGHVEDLSGPERLHTASTFSSRIRSKCQENAPTSCIRSCHNVKTISNRNVHSAPILGHQKINKEEQPLRRACSCIRVEKDSVPVRKDRTPSCSSNLIKVQKQPVKKKCDPVSLYHYYTTLWAKYKPNVPGENNWSDLRWQIRQKMAGHITKATNKKEG